MIGHHASQKRFSDFRRLPEAVFAFVEVSTFYQRLR